MCVFFLFVLGGGGGGGEGGGGGVSGENCHFRLRSTTSGPHFDPHDTHSLHHMTQMNELKTTNLNEGHIVNCYNTSGGA